MECEIQSSLNFHGHRLQLRPIGVWLSFGLRLLQALLIGSRLNGGSHSLIILELLQDLLFQLGCVTACTTKLTHTQAGERACTTFPLGFRHIGETVNEFVVLFLVQVSHPFPVTPALFGYTIPVAALPIEVADAVPPEVFVAGGAQRKLEKLRHDGFWIVAKCSWIAAAGIVLIRVKGIACKSHFL